MAGPPTIPPLKIARLRAVQPETPGSPPDWRTQLGQIVVEVTSECGLTGIGVGGGGAAGIHVVHTVLRDLLIGRTAEHIESLHAKMCRHTEFYGRTGIVVMAISGVDLALWDLVGKATEQPVAKLLNPDADLTRPIPTYVTVFGEHDTEAALAAGHAAVKLHVERFGTPPDVDAIAREIDRVRQQLGNRAALMIDAFASWDVDSTLCVAEAIASFDVDWLEEPLSPDDFDGYRQLAEQAVVPIAGGEHEYLQQGFRRVIEGRLHRILQPDINWCGGLTTLRQVYQMGAAAGLRVCPHRGSEPYALHAISALDPEPPEPLAESARTWFQCLEGSPVIQDGLIAPAAGAGFGVNIDESVWNRHG